MPVSSYVLSARSQSANRVVAALKPHGNIVVGEPDADVLPVAVASDSEKEAIAWAEMIESIPEVENLSLVYHNFEDTPVA